MYWKHFWLWVVTVLLAIGLIRLGFNIVHHFQTNTGSNSGQNHNSSGSSGGTSNLGGYSGSQGDSGGSSGGRPSSGNRNSHPPKLVWGFDTTSKINSSAYKCVSSNFGKPDFVARYLTTKKGVYTGLNQSEAKFIHSKKVKILPIYDQFTNATGSKQGMSSAQQAIKLVKSLGTPKGTLIAADIEKGTKIDSSFLIGWTTTLKNAGYKAGLYGDLTSSSIKSAYNQAAKQSKTVKTNLLIWTNQPSIGIKGKSNVPDSFKGNSPNQSQTLVWQYGINSKKCNIDTDLAKGSLLKSLW